MPTYEYECTVCNNIQDKFHGMNEKIEIVCDSCGSICKKNFSTNGNFILKGADWPSQSFKLKDEMTKKNIKMKLKMVERESSGEGVTSLSNIKK